MSHRVSASVFVLIAGLLTACGGGGSGTFPNFADLAKQAVPSFASSRTSPVLQRFSSLRAFPAYGSLGNSTQWDSETSVSNNSIGQVLNDAGPSGPVKSMFVLLDGAQSRMESINSDYTDADGNPDNCTAIPAGTTLTVPFWKNISDSSLTFDADKYTCYATNGSSNGYSFFGRSAIASPPAGCTDAFEYHVMDGYSADDQATQAQDAGYGATQDLGAIARYYYNGCTKDFKIAFAHFGKYSGGAEFDSRAEISGNSQAGTFTIRSGFIDADATLAAAGGYNMNTFAGNGQSQLEEGTSGTAHFLIGARLTSCPTASCNTPTDSNFCGKNTSTDRTGIAFESDGTQCSSLATVYNAIDPLDLAADYPRALFTTNLSDFGL
jgi:hypothetical protein